MIIHVRNFGKIESADIDLSNLVVFVGENNSGKTYLMQLIYGLFSFFCDINLSDIGDIVSGLEFDNNRITIKAEDSDFYKNFQIALNNCINKNKDVIIESIFHTNSLSIDSLEVEFDALQDDFSLIYEGEFEKNKKLVKRYAILKNDKSLYKIGFNGHIPENFIDIVTVSELIKVLLSELTGFLIDGRNQNHDEKSFIYLPASRSGIMLLYANYLSNDEKEKNENDEYSIERESNEDIENKYGLTEPVYNFLTFLLKYKYSENNTEKNKNIISFIDNNIINGHLEKVGNTMRYTPKKAEQSIPIYLSSSLVSELSPIYQILSGIQRFSYIMYDEIETCQHPTKQLQLARLLIRMVNDGYKMIVSTHSDTMAASINNLVTLSFKEKKDELISKMGYEKEDILNSDSIKAYQFLISENGKTRVEEVKSYFSIGIGFDFDLFNKTNDKIYQDAAILAEVE